MDKEQKQLLRELVIRIYNAAGEDGIKFTYGWLFDEDVKKEYSDIVYEKWQIGLE